MKFLTLILLLSMSPLMANATCGEAHGASVDTSTTEGVALIKVSGMACSACVQKLSDEVAKIPHNKVIKIDVSKNLVKVDYKEAKLTPAELTKLKEQIAQAVEKAQFKLEKSS